MKYRTTGDNSPLTWVFALTGRVILCFALLCVILAAIGGLFFFSLRSIEKLDSAKRSSYVDTIAVLHRIDKNVSFQQTEVLRHLTTTDPGEKKRQEQVIAGLRDRNSTELKNYERNIDKEAETQLFADVLRARKAYFEQTEQLFVPSREGRTVEATFLLATQVPTYDRYQSSLDALVRFEEAEGRALAATATNVIQQTRIVGNILIGLAIVITLGTGASVWRIVGRLKHDKANLQTAVKAHERAEQALREGEARYRLLVDHSPDAILVVCDEKIVFANPATLELLGADRVGQLVGRSVLEILHPDEHAEVARRSKEVAAGGQPPATARRFLRLDGSVVEVESRVISFLYEGKQAVQVIAQDRTVRKAVEAQLRQADEKYRSIFENALEGIFQNTPEGVFISANPALARMLGFASPEELIRERNDVERQGYAESAKREEFKRLLEESGVVENFEYEVKRKDGSTIWVSENVRIVRDASGKALYYEGSAQDITERKQAEAALSRSQTHTKAIVQSSLDCILTIDHEGKLLEFNPAAELIFGYERAKVLGMELAEVIIPPSLRERHRQGMARYLATGEMRVLGKRIEITAMRSDGSEFPVELSITRLGTDEPPMFTGFIRDITERKQAEQKLVEQADLLDLAQDAIMVRGMDDRIQFWNHGAEVLYGWTAEEALGQLTGHLLQYEEPIKILAERILLETGAWSGDCRHLTKAGNSVIVRSRWTLVRDEHGQPKSKLVIATDMTEQKKIEEQFLRAQRLESIGTLASGVAHDLNNILAPIMMAAPVLRGETDPAERERFLDIVESSASRGADVIKQMLTFARGADGDHLLLQPIYLLEEVSKIAGRTFPKSIALRTSYDENIRSLEADPTQLHQVLLNLCINARDAMPNGGDLCLGLENFDVDERCASMNPGATAGPHVMLQVTDSGSGIPKKVIDKIFDPFFTTKSIGHGTGLGLSTVAGIVRSHGGFIRVESEPGRTSFKIFLPAKAAFNTATTQKVDAMIPHGNGQTILLVDDEPSIREVAELILKSHGYNVLLAEDGSAALALFARQMGLVSVVITDLAMPGMDGLMLVHTLRRMHPGLKIIVSTGRTDDSRAAEIAALNIDGSITKPYTTRSLLLKLSHVLHSGMQDAA